MVLRMASKRWLLTSILVVAAMAITARLGIWQLDRLAVRRAFNARVEAQISRDMLILDQRSLVEPALPGELASMEYRAVTVRGEYDHQHQIALRNQYFNNQYGVHLVTPLKIAGTDKVILVDRGWIPAKDWENGVAAQYDEPGIVEIEGILRASQSKADFGRLTDPILAPAEGPLLAWNFINIERLNEQSPYSLLPAYIQQAPDPQWQSLPYRTQPELELTEGSHMSYAIQWFFFTGLLAVGYPFYIRKQEQRFQALPVPITAPNTEPHSTNANASR